MRIFSCTPVPPLRSSSTASSCPLLLAPTTSAESLTVTTASGGSRWLHPLRQPRSSAIVLMRKAAVTQAFARNDSGLLKQPARVNFDTSVVHCRFSGKRQSGHLRNLSPLRMVSTPHRAARQGTLLCAMKPVRRCSMTKLAVLTSAALLAAATAFAQTTSAPPGASPRTAPSGPASTDVAPRTTGPGAATGAETTSSNPAGASNAEQPERAGQQTGRGGTGGAGGGGSQ